ncbi:MAG: hypothetical protein EOO83_01720, partial [Oxalobacteraceae bacterium]
SDAPITRISVDGGVSRSRYLCQFLADTTGCTVVIPSVDELTAYGTAQLAACALGETLETPQPSQTIIPNRCDGAARLARFAQAALRRHNGWGSWFAKAAGSPTFRPAHRRQAGRCRRRSVRRHWG